MRKNNILVLGLGAIFLIIALVILGDILGFLKANNIFGQYWPLALVLIGVVSFGAIPGGNGFAAGLMILGTLLTLRNFGVFAGSAGNIVFLVLLCLAAIAILTFGSAKKPE